MKRYAWQILRKEATFTAVSGELQAGIIPADFDRFVSETFWDRGNERMISGPITAVEWQSRKAVSYNGPYRKFIYRGGQVFVFPPLGGGEPCAYEYVSKNWVDTTGDGAGDAAAFQADSDSTLLDSELLVFGIVYAWLLDEGQPTAPRRLKDFEDRLTLLVRQDQPNARILAAGDIFGRGRHFTGAPMAAEEFYWRN